MSFQQNNIDYFTLAFGGGTPLKAFLTACVVGTILTSINHGDQILAGNFPHPLKVALTYCVPYIVTTWGAITGKLQRIATNVQNFLNQNKILELSFFNFENAITAAYYADSNLKVIKANKNFSKFFPSLQNINDDYFPNVLKKIGVSSEQIETFKSEIEEKGSVFIPKIEISSNGEGRVFSLLSTKTDNASFGYLNGIQGQLIDRSGEFGLKQ
ncbi:MAG: nitrate/nitrite transporter NrtS [Paracoccaceae bacterium]|tara:strand:+ start:49 stop:687 length:639 start_codon:yes stop_codon:yes gene_type:complete